MIWLGAAVPFSQSGVGLPLGHLQRTGSGHFLSFKSCGFHALQCGFLLDPNRKASAMQGGQGARRHPAPFRAVGQWLARKAPEVMASDGLRPSVEPQWLWVLPDCGWPLRRRRLAGRAASQAAQEIPAEVGPSAEQDPRRACRPTVRVNLPALHLFRVPVPSPGFTDLQYAFRVTARTSRCPSASASRPRGRPPSFLESPLCALAFPCDQRTVASLQRAPWSGR